MNCLHSLSCWEALATPRFGSCQSLSLYLWPGIVGAGHHTVSLLGGFNAWAGWLRNGSSAALCSKSFVIHQVWGRHPALLHFELQEPCRMKFMDLCRCPKIWENVTWNFSNFIHCWCIVRATFRCLTWCWQGSQKVKASFAPRFHAMEITTSSPLLGVLRFLS